MKVLVVEDNFIAGLDMTQRLTAFGCEVLGPFAGVEEVLELLKTTTPDGAFLDFSLRNETSIPIAEALQEEGCPFAFVTGYSEPPGFPDSFAGYPRVSKPFDSQALETVLRTFESHSSDVG